MINIDNISYLPILKTTDAELKAFEHLDDTLKEEVLPVFELTRSRKSKKNMDRSIFIRLNTLKELVGDRPFILDLTTEKQLTNEQIDHILDTFTDGFPLWIDLIRQSQAKGLNIIPVIHYDEQNLEDVAKEVENLFRLSDILAFRVPVSDAISYLETMVSMGISLHKIIVILDAAYQEPRGDKDKSSLFTQTLDELITKFSDNLPKVVACAFSTFPDSVAKYGEDDKGTWPRYEKYTYQILKNKYQKNLTLKYSDYSSVHPYRYDTTGGQWIPRIDFMNSEYMCYYRARREDGGYPYVAKRVLSDKNYMPIKTLKTWGDNEIEIAGTLKPNGASPSYWISVRINLYITRTLMELRN